MRQLPEGRNGQALALAIGAIGLVAFYILILSPALQFFGDRADLLDQRVKVAQRYKALAHELPALRAADKTWRDRSGGELLLDWSSDAIASAALQAAMKGLVEDTGARLSSSEVLQPAPAGNFRRVGIRVVFSGDLKVVTAVLRGVETSRPVLSVGDFSLRSGSNRGEGGDSTNDRGGGDDDTLAVTLDIYGFRAV